MRRRREAGDAGAPACGLVFALTLMLIAKWEKAKQPKKKRTAKLNNPSPQTPSPKKRKSNTAVSLAATLRYRVFSSGVY
jgi:hypothetical protein